MNHLKITLTALLLSCCTFLSAQERLSIDNLPKTADDFADSEPNVLATIEWLENTPFGEQEEERELQNGLLLIWVMQSPTVTVELNDNTLPFIKKNSELLVLFMGGWTRYALENDYSKDVFRGTLAGIRCAMKVYKGGGMKKNKEMEKLVILEQKGELESWVKEQLNK